MKLRDMTLDGHTALVTGAAGGIGSAICRHLALAGANVAVCDVDGDAEGRSAAGGVSLIVAVMATYRLGSWLVNTVVTKGV
jgi:NAD(P)-dependent dehydrogenase (short-subunit alcohol dehydrogenase family)